MEQSTGLQRSPRVSAMNWFHDHPIVATVLWALGTEVKSCILSMEQENGPSKQNENVRRNISGDTCNSNILYSNQSSSPAAEHNVKDEGGVLLPHRSALSSIDSSHIPDSVSPDMSSPWGFFVPITPPSRDPFSKEEKFGRSIR